MRVCILAHKFPAFSETFVIDHAKALIDAEIDLRILACNGDNGAWASTDDYESILRANSSYYERPDSDISSYRRKRAAFLFRFAMRHIRHRSLRHLAALNVFRFGSSVLDVKLPYVYDKALEIGPVDVLHCHFGSNGILGAQLKQLGFCKKLVVTFHGLDVSKVILAKKNARLYQRLFREADLILPISQRWRDALISAGAHESKTKVHYLGVNVEQVSPSNPGPDSSAIRIVTTARFTEKKGIPHALRAIALVKEREPGLKIQYDLIGTGKDLAEIKKLICDLGLQTTVQLHGAQPHSFVVQVLQRSDIFMLPSLTASNGDQEGIPVSLMEAMAHGIPVLSTRHSGIPELVEDGYSGVLVEEKNHEQLAEAIIRLAASPGLRRSLSRNARQTVEKHFNARIQNASLIDKYNALVAT